MSSNKFFNFKAHVHEPYYNTMLNYHIYVSIKFKFYHFNELYILEFISDEDGIFDYAQGFKYLGFYLEKNREEIYKYLINNFEFQLIGDKLGFKEKEVDKVIEWLEGYKIMKNLTEG